MSSAMQNGLISLNSQHYPLDEARISPIDRGFLFGDSVFEVMLAFGGEILSWREHLERLRFSAESVAMDLPWSPDELFQEMNDIVAKLAYPKTYLRLIVSRGQGWKLKIPESPVLNKVLIALPALGEPKSHYVEGIRLKSENSYSSKRGPLIKSSQYLSSIAAIKRAEAENFDDTLWVNAFGEVTEATTANIFFVKKGASKSVITPSLNCGLLAGITRQTALNVLRDAGWKCEEGTIYANELGDFSEAFITSTIRGLLPLKNIDQHMYTTASAHSSYRQAFKLFMDWTAHTLGRRVDWMSGETLK